MASPKPTSDAKSPRMFPSRPVPTTTCILKHRLWLDMSSARRTNLAQEPTWHHNRGNMGAIDARHHHCATEHKLAELAVPWIPRMRTNHTFPNHSTALAFHEERSTTKTINSAATGRREMLSLGYFPGAQVYLIAPWRSKLGASTSLALHRLRRRNISSTAYQKVQQQHKEAVSSAPGACPSTIPHSHQLSTSETGSLETPIFGTSNHLCESN